MGVIPRKAVVGEVPVLDLAPLMGGGDIRPLAHALRAACEDIGFVSLCLPADCFDRQDSRTSHSLSRHALCPTINNCRSYVDIVGKTRTCDETGCSNHPIGFIKCYEPDGDDQ